MLKNECCCEYVNLSFWAMKIKRECVICIGYTRVIIKLITSFRMTYRRYFLHRPRCLRQPGVSRCYSPELPSTWRCLCQHLTWRCSSRFVDQHTVTVSIETTTAGSDSKTGGTDSLRIYQVKSESDYYCLWSACLHCLSEDISWSDHQ